MTNSKNFKLFSLIFIVLLFSGTVFAQVRSERNELGDTILVEVGGDYITNSDLQQKIETLPVQQIARYKTLSGQRQILEMMITEAVFYKKSLELGIDQLPEVQNAIFVNSQPVISQIYFETILDREFSFDPNSVEKFYNEHISFYTIHPIVTIQHLQATSESVEAVLEALANEEAFSDIIEKYSTNSITAGQRGMIRNIRLNGFIAGIGPDPDLDEHIAEVTVDSDMIYGPFETATGIHFFKKLDHEPAIIRPFAEVKDEIEARLLSQGEHEVYLAHIDYLTNKYNVVFMSDMLESMNMMNIPPYLSNSMIVQSNHPDVRITFGEAERLMRNSANREIAIDLNSPNVQQMIIQNEINRRLLNAAATEANTFELYADRHEMREMRLRMILSYFYNTELVNKIEVTRDELLDFYENNTERYTVPAHRSIRQFVSVDERAARKHHNQISRMLRRNQMDRIIDYITKESLQGHSGGLLNHIYKNNIVPSVGVDEVYNQKIFEAEIGQLSDIFRNVNNEVVFFFVVEEIPQSIRPLSDVENSLMGMIHRQKVAELSEQRQTELMEEYNVVTHFDRITHAITAEDLFSRAELSQRMGQYQETIFYFDQIANDYEGSEYAYRALFMKGFVATELLNDAEIAVEAFQELLDKFPEGELNESTQFMLDALLNGVPLEMLFGN